MRHAAVYHNPERPRRYYLRGALAVAESAGEDGFRWRVGGAAAGTARAPAGRADGPEA